MHSNFTNSILIVDDMSNNRYTDRLIIQTHFPKLIIHEASSAQEALVMLKEHDIDLILCDIFMPDIDGFELAQKVKETFNDPNLSIIFVTASSESEELKKRGIAIGALDFIQRPYDPNTLINRIKLYLNLYKKNQELQKQIINNETNLELVNRYVISSKTDLQGIITEVTDAFCDISGYSRDELIGQPHNIVRHPDTPKEIFDELWSSIKKGNIWSGEIKNRRKDGSHYWVHAVISPLISIEGKHIGYISTRQNITEIRKQKLELQKRDKQLQDEMFSRQEAEQLAHEIIESTDNMVAVTSAEQPIFFNHAMLKFLNIESIEAFKSQFTSLYDFFEKHSDLVTNIDLTKNWLDLICSLNHENPISMKSLGTQDTRKYNLQMKRLHTKEDRYLFNFLDVTDLEDKRQYYEDLATHDTLTGISNRYFFTHSIKREIQASIRDHRPMTLIMIDIDHFKAVNDTYGHDEGDNVIKEFASIIKGRLRSSDIVARWGGEEFIVMLPSTGSPEAEVVAESIRHTIETTHFNHVGKITCSLGVSTLYASDSMETVIKRADMALYEAKHSGRNCVKTNNEKIEPKVVYEK